MEALEWRATWRRRASSCRGGEEGAGGALVAAAAARHDDVPVVLDGVVGAAGEEAGDERPPVAVGAVRLQEPLLLRRREGPLVDPRVQLVEPPEPATLPCKIDQLQCCSTLMYQWHGYHAIEPVLHVRC
jgi:hypothetical protein